MKGPRIGGALALVLVLGACSHFPGAQVCVPEFPLTDGFLGADGAYSVPLDEGRSLWLFGDTFIGETRADAALVPNTAAISHCRDGFRVAYHWRRGPEPAAIFASDTPDVAYWPLDGALIDGTLHVFLMRKRTTGAGPFDFVIEGVDEAVVAEWSDAPERWQAEIAPVTREAGLLLGASILREGEWLYLAAADLGPKSQPTLLFRRLAQGGRPAAGGTVETWTAGGWRTGLLREAALPILPEGASELSIRRSGDEYVAAYLPTFAREIAIATAPELTGPWRVVKRIGVGDVGAEVFCYAAKEHVQLAAGAERIGTYACNAAGERVLTDLSLYRPKPFRFRLEELRPSSR